MTKAKKTTATKTVTSSPRKPRRSRLVPLNAIVLDDPILWAVLERKLFGSTVLSIHTTREDAANTAAVLDAASGVSFNKYIVQRAPLANVS